MIIEHRTRIRAPHLLTVGITICLLLTTLSGAVALPQPDPEQFMVVVEGNPLPGSIDLRHAGGVVGAQLLAGDRDRFVAMIPRSAMTGDGSISLRPQLERREMREWSVYVLPGWDQNVLRNIGPNWLRRHSLCFERGTGTLPERLTVDRYPAVTLGFEEGRIDSMLIAGLEILGEGSGFSIGDTLRTLEGRSHGAVGTVRVTYQDPVEPQNTLEIVATPMEPDRTRFDCTYRATRGRDESVPVHLTLRPGGTLLDMRGYTWRDGGAPEQSTLPLPGAGAVGEEFIHLAQMPFVRIKSDTGAWMGVLDHDQSNLVVSAGRDANAGQFVRVSSYLWPRERGQTYTWSFELIGGWVEDYNALLQALAPHTSDFEEHFTGAMVNQERAQDFEAAHQQGASVLWHHAWFHRNGAYFDPALPFDQLYQTVRGTNFSYRQLQSNIDAAEEAGITPHVYFQFAGVSEDITERFDQSLVRNADGETIVAGRDDDYSDIFVNPDPEGTWGSSVLRQLDQLLDTTGAAGVALDRTDSLDWTYDPDVYDYGSFNGYSSVFRHAGSRQPVSSITIAGRNWMDQLRATLDTYEATLISGDPLSLRVVSLSDGVLIDQPMTPNSLLFMKALANGKSLYISDTHRDIESPSDEPLEARLAQARPHLSNGGRWEDPGRMGRLLYAVSEGPAYPTLWYFDNGYTRMRFDPDARTVPAMYSGSEFVPLGDERTPEATTARGGAAASPTETLLGTPAEAFAELPRFGARVFGAEEDEDSDEADVPVKETADETAERPAATATEAVPPTYVIGPGDELAVRVWTDTIEHISASPTVDADGDIYLNLIGAVNVAGETISEVRTDLKARFARFFDRAQVNVGLARTRVIEVRVTGDVQRPGKYRLSGGASVFSALYAAGGPSEIGSLRKIRLIRAGDTQIEIDLYDYLLHGDPSGDLPLEPEDTVFVAPAGPTAGITGQIQRPARYELTQDATLPELIEMAGGLASTAYTRGVQIWRAGAGGERELLNVDLADQSERDFIVRGGDIVFIPSILEEPTNTVQISGPVRRPGNYQYHEGMTVSSLIDDAHGLTTEVHMEEAYLSRLNEDLDYEVSSIDLRAALRGAPGDDPTLAPGDRLVILSENEVEAPMLVSVEGAVGNPTEIPWHRGMRVSHLVKQAGGLVEDAYTPRANLLRIGEDQRRELIAVDLGDAVAGDPEADLLLERGDVLRVLTRHEITEASRVRVAGLVRREGWYDRPQGMRVSDAILAAGGLTDHAGSEIQYTRGGTVGEVQPIYLSLQHEDGALAVEPDLVVRDNDLIAVLGAGNLVSSPPSVTIRGSVETPGAYALQSTPGNPDTVYDLINRAGGLLPNANPDGIVLYRLREEIIANEQEDDLEQVIAHFNRELSSATVEGEEQRTAGTAAQISQGLQAALSEGASTVVIPPRRLSKMQWARAVPINGSALIATEGRDDDFALAPGDVVVVPETPTTVTVMGAVVRPGAVPFTEDMTPRDYVNKAGDFTPDARKALTVVIRANGEVTPKALHTQIKPGDIILVPSDYVFRNVNKPGTLERVLNAVTGIVGGYLIFN